MWNKVNCTVCLIMQVISDCRSLSWPGVRRWSSVSHVPPTASTTFWQLTWCTAILTWSSWWTPSTTCARRAHISCGPCAFVWTQRTASWTASSSASTWSCCTTSPVWASSCSAPGGGPGGPRTRERLLPELSNRGSSEHSLSLSAVSTTEPQKTRRRKENCDFFFFDNPGKRGFGSLELTPDDFMNLIQKNLSLCDVMWTIWSGFFPV